MAQVIPHSGIMSKEKTTATPARKISAAHVRALLGVGPDRVRYREVKGVSASHVRRIAIEESAATVDMLQWIAENFGMDAWMLLHPSIIEEFGLITTADDQVGGPRVIAGDRDGESEETTQQEDGKMNWSTMAEKVKNDWLTLHNPEKRKYAAELHAAAERTLKLDELQLHQIKIASVTKFPTSKKEK